ncbi:RER2 [[Candida] subhashii]|uniref:Alkyl transferase n=1 Tax=[Candida] subhashii TaxID=561895 RepID=A0A8J5UHM7_9ASCO|nr:RER2 [[Candida] subhashii]KAG7660932.1 RER2 [[Candida] subhashii]
MPDWMSTFPGYQQFLAYAKSAFGGLIQTGPVPRHVGIIMDGNRRYAKSHKIEIKEGHSLGFETMASVLELLYESGVDTATVYAFSIENFKRSKYEVEWLMDLAKSKFKQLLEHGQLAEKYGVRIKIIGNRHMLPQDVLEVLQEVEEMTKDHKRATLNVCFPYTSRDEMTHSIKQTVEDSTNQPNILISQQYLNDNLYTKEAPPLDLLVRTSGTYRLSDFLLWQCVSPDCTIVFIDKLWPEFQPWDMAKMLINWSFNKYWYGHANGYLLTEHNKVSKSQKESQEQSSEAITNNNTELRTKQD